MKIAFKFILSLALALLLVWAIRTYAFTVFSVPAGGLPPQLKEGNRVIVNRLDCDFFDYGELIVYADSVGVGTYAAKPSYPGGTREKGHVYKTWEEQYFIGQIEKKPGDTLQIKDVRYVIPFICCNRCGCKDCRYYLVRTSSGKHLVHKHQILGKAYKLF